MPTNYRWFLPDLSLTEKYPISILCQNSDRKIICTIWTGGKLGNTWLQPVCNEFGFPAIARVVIDSSSSPSLILFIFLQLKSNNIDNVCLFVLCLLNLFCCCFTSSSCYFDSFQLDSIVISDAHVTSSSIRHTIVWRHYFVPTCWPSSIE